MKKRTCLPLILILTCIQWISAQDYTFQRGYKGFGDVGYTIGMGDDDVNVSRFEALTSHGYQFNPYLFIGLGTGAQVFFIQTYSGPNETTTVIPFFADFRGNFMTGKIVPFAGVKAGYSFVPEDDFTDLGLFINPNVGVKYMFSDRFGLNVNIGYSVQLYENLGYNQMGVQTWSNTKNMGGISFKVGVEF